VRVQVTWQAWDRTGAPATAGPDAPQVHGGRNLQVLRWQGMDDGPHGWGPSVVTIGIFDGVHRGHQRIVGRATAVAAERGLPVAVVTFDPHPDEVIRPGSHPPLLCSPRRRAELLGELGACAVWLLPFTLEFSRLGPDDFVRTVLADRLGAAAVVVGENFRFGHRAAGNIALLSELGEKYEFTAEGVPLLAEGAVTISSSLIREHLAAGEVAAAAADLGRPHRVEGVVVRGHQRGRALGFPTANLQTPPYAAVPADGVYAGWLTAFDPDGAERERWPAAISVGSNPTFDGTERTVEAHALDRDDLDLYGTHVAVDFAARLRGMIKFGSADELVSQMRLDVDAARTITAPGPG
jgi:riboflavin kinase / FMN adenylyltransferase